MDHIFVGAKGSNYDGKYGKLHLSKEKVWTINGAFIVPKASPLHVSSIHRKFKKIPFFKGHRISE